MVSSVKCTRVNHINMVVEDFDKSVEHFGELYGAEFLLDLRKPEMQAGLVEAGQVIIEIYAPPIYLINARYGPHYLGVEYQVNMTEAREAIASHGIRIVRDIGVALHTHPADGFGVAFEFWDGEFLSWDWKLLGGGKMKSAEYWRDEHALGLTGLKAYTVAVNDIAAATSFFKSFLAGEQVYEAPRPEVAARAVGLHIGDAVMELMTPTGDGPLQRYLTRYGQGIYSTVFGVRDLDQARHYFGERGVVLHPGSSPDTIAVPAESNLGMIFEFAQHE